MFGFSLIPTKELELERSRVSDLKYMLERMESELHYWRNRADEERERADRINDVVMQQNGLPDVTPTVIKEKRGQADKLEEEIKRKEVEVAEMFSDSLDAQDDLNWLDPDLHEAARTWMQTAKEARDARKNEPAGNEA